MDNEDDGTELQVSYQNSHYYFLVTRQSIPHNALLLGETLLSAVKAPENVRRYTGSIPAEDPTRCSLSVGSLTHSGWGHRSLAELQILLTLF